MENLLKPEIISAVGWTLLHSLWQGIVLAILYFGISKFLKSAETKYTLGILAMISQFIFAIGTFYYVADFNREVIITKVMHYFSNSKDPQLEIGLLEAIQLFLSTNMNLIVKIWLIGISIFFIKLMFDILAVNRLKTTGLKPVDNQTFSKFDELTSYLKITRKIEIFESHQTLSPIVIGNLKPFILLPIGLTSGLTINELEAILAHELAHIKRYDFIVNILQSFIEITFFFNPTIWWISSQVRLEREHCCDDFSVAITGDKLLLVSALTQVETFRINQPLVMAFGKKRMTLLNRVKRILGVKAIENRSFESIIVMIFASILVGGIMIFKSYNVVAKAGDISKKIQNYSDLKSSSNAYTKPKILSNEIQKHKSNQVTIVDTIISKGSTNSSSRETKIDGDNFHRYVNSNSRRGEFWINRVGEIYVDGKKYDASPELLAKIKPYLKKMDDLSDEMSVYSKTMEEYSKDMSVFSKKMEDKSGPMQILGKQMEVQGKLLEKEVKLQTKFSLQASSADTNKEKSTKESYEKLEKEHKKNVDKISKEMDRLGKEMEKIGKIMEENGKPMEEIGKKMELEGKKMEIVGKKMEIVSKEIINLLPNDLKKKIKDIEKGSKE